MIDWVGNHTLYANKDIDIIYHTPYDLSNYSIENLFEEE